MKPCLKCGEPTQDTRCPEHTDQRRRSSRAAGYDWSWDKLSARARRIQPWCTDCGAEQDLTTDHLPQAWERKAKGLPIRLVDVEVTCMACNIARGPARGSDPARGGSGRRGEARTELRMVLAKPEDAP